MNDNIDNLKDNQIDLEVGINMKHRLFHQTIELKHFSLSMKLMHKIYLPYYPCKFEYYKIPQCNFYSFSWYWFGWEIFSLAIIWENKKESI